MTNISEDRRVVLTALREVPYETTFLLSDATQDQFIKNRYWFDLPSQWTHQANKDSIIGIRDIYFTKTNRFIKYSYKVSLLYSDEPIDIIEGTISTWLDGGNDTIRHLTDKFNEKWLTNGKRTNTCTDEQHTWKTDEIVSYFDFDNETKKTFLYFGRGIGEEPYFSLDDGNECILLPYQVELTAISDDTKLLFGGEHFIAEANNNKPCRISIPMWSRHQCLVKSSIATSDKNNILGHTLARFNYTPIKYYRLNHDVKKFWIELYETRYHESPVEFPSDKRDDLIIEAIVCFSSQAML